MVKEWTIYDKNNTAKAVVKDVELHDVWMGEEYVTMTFTSPTPIQFEIGDYLVYRGATYSIYNVPSVLKSARVSTYGEGFKYDNVKFSARSTELTEIRFHDVVLNDNDLHYTSLAVFSFYCNSVDDLVDRLQANTNRDASTDWYFITPSKNRTLQRYEGDATKQAEALRLWNEAYGNTYYDDNVTEGKENVNISVSNISVWDGLALIKNNFGLNYITRDRAVIVGGEGIPTARIFKYGKGNGLYEIERIADTEQQVVTKLFAYGSEKNLPVRYYANLNMRVFATVTRIVTTSPLIYAMLDLDFSGSLFTNRNESTGNEQYIVTVDDLNGHVETNAMVNLPIGEVPSEEAGKTEIILNWDYPVSVGTRLYFTAGVNRDKWSPDHQDYATENLPNNMAVNSLMLPGFPNYSLAQLCRCVIADGKTTIEIRKTPTSTYTELMTIDGERNLVFSDNKLHPYILSDNAETIGIKEGDIHFTEDTDDNGLKEIYPSIEGMTQGDVFGTSSQVRLDEIHLVDVIEDNGVYAEGTEVQNFKITLKNIGFDLKEAFANAGDSMVISMKDGFCGGRDFNVKSVKQNEDGTWVLNTERSHDDALDLWFPYSDGVSHGHSASSIEPYQIKVGDHFVLTNIELEDTNYVWAASVKLLRNSITWLLNNDYTRFTYLPKVDEIYMARQHDEATRTLTTSLHDTLKAGMLMQFQDTDLNIDGQVFIDNLTIKENGNNGIPTYDVTLRNDKQVGTLQRVQNQINSLASSGGSGSGGGGGINLNQVRGEVESYGNEFFLSKLSDDTAQGEIGFLKGIWIKAKGLFGFDADGNIKANGINATGDAKIGGEVDAQSGKIDSVQSHNYTGDGIADTGYRLTSDDGTGSSALTVDNLHVRKKATFEELEVKKETAVAGNEVRSAAANVINRTDYLDANGNLLGYSFLTMPWLLKGVPHLLNGIFFGRQRRIRTTLKPEDVSRIATIRCYFLAKDDDREVNNLWEVGDLVRCQTINMNNSQRKTYLPSGSTSKVGNVFWWRKATGKSNAPVTLEDEKQYHYVDVSMSDCATGSDIPCAGDHMVQFGHDSNPDRMNIIVQEVNGDDAPAIKSYMGIYTYDLTKCWWGGDTPLKMKLSPKSGYIFYGPMFNFTQEYGIVYPSIDRGAWDDITPERDDYAPHNNVRKCYYYDKVTHKGCYWLCVYTPSGNGVHWVDANGNYLTDEQYNALTKAQKETCTRKQDYTTVEPGTDATKWLKQVDRGTSVQSVTSYYAKQLASQYTGEPPTEGWQRSIAAVGTLNEGDYLWTKNVTTYSDTLQDTTTYTVSKWGIDGDGIHNIETKFYENAALLTQAQLNGTDQLPGGGYITDNDWKEYSQLSLTQGDYIYTRTNITYDKSSTPTVSYQVNRIGQDGVGYVGTEEYYCLGNSMTTPPTGHPYQGTNHGIDRITPTEMATRMAGGSWSEARPTYQGDANKYIWNFEASYSTNANEVLITEPVCIGDYSKGIASIVETYAISASAVAPQAGGYPADITTWTDEAHDCAPTDEKPYQWNKTVTTYTDGSSDTFYHVSAVKGTNGKDAAEVRPNLLKQTQFISGHMNQWYLDGGEIIVNGFDGHNTIHLNLSNTIGQYVQGTGHEVLEPATVYTISFWSKGVIFIDINPGDTGEAYAVFDRTFGRWIDGVKVSDYVEDFGYIWEDSDWTYHTYTFKTAAAFDGSLANLYWHSPSWHSGSAGCYLCMPKLERGDTATAYLANEWDTRGIVSTNIFYTADASAPQTPSGAPIPSGWADDGNTLITKANADANKHLYESTCTTFTDGTYSWTTPLDDGLIADMAATSEEFAIADSGTTAPTSGWSSSVTPTAGKWIWSRTVLTFRSGNPKYINTQCVGYCGLDSTVPGPQGFGVVLTLTRDNYNESSWAQEAIVGQSNWFDYNGGVTVRAGDYFVVKGVSTDKGLMHVATFECTSQSSTTITGNCISHIHDGEGGSPGADAWSVAASPSPLIINQNIDNASDFGLPIEINFTGKCGDNTATVGTVNTTNSMGLDITPGSGKITITRYRKVNDVYVTSGVIVCTVPLSYGTRSTSVTFNISVGVNMIGQFSDEIKGDMRIELAQSFFYEIDNDPTSPTYNELIESQNSAEYRRSSTESISRLEATSNSRNMLDCASGDGWRNWEDDNLSKYNNTTQMVGDNDQQAEDIDVYSKAVFLKLGVTYVVSVYTSLNPNINIYSCKNNPNANVNEGLDIVARLAPKTLPDDTYMNCTRFYDSFTVSSDGYYVVDVFNLKNFYRPQLEVGDTPTAWVPGTLKNASSEIKQTADRIEAKVNDTGVRINDGYIDLMAGRVNFVDSNGNPFQTPKIVIDPTTGALYAVDGVFSGKVESASTKGKWVIEPHIGNNAVPRISGQDGNGNEKVVIFFDADDFDSTYVRDGGGMMFIDISEIDGSLNSRFCRNAWRTNCSGYGEEDQNTHKTRATYISSLAEHGNPRLHFYDNYDGSAHSLTVGLNLNGAFLSGDWLSKSQATANGMTYVDDWGNVRVKKSNDIEQINVRRGDCTLPKNAPIGTVFFVKGTGSFTRVSIPSDSSDQIENYDDNRIIGDKNTAVGINTASAIFVKTETNKWTYYIGI